MNKLIETLIYVYGSDKLILKHFPYYKVELEENKRELDKAERLHKAAVKFRYLYHSGFYEYKKPINERW